MPHARSIVLANHDFAHQRLAEVIGDCPPELLLKLPEGSTANPIGATYAHALFVEDQLVHGMVRGGPTIFEGGGWAERTGVQMHGAGQDREWALGVRLSLAPFTEYAASVRAATVAYLEGATDAEFERQVEMPGGAMSALGVVATVAWHLGFHTGEISALKGTEGLRGFPFL